MDWIEVSFCFWFSILAKEGIAVALPFLGGSILHAIAISHPMSWAVFAAIFLVAVALPGKRLAFAIVAIACVGALAWTLYLFINSPEHYSCLSVKEAFNQSMATLPVTLGLVAGLCWRIYRRAFPISSIDWPVIVTAMLGAIALGLILPTPWIDIFKGG